MRVKLSELAERFGLVLKGEDREVTGVAALDAAGPDEVSFLHNPKYAAALETTRAAAVIVAPEHADAAPAALVTGNPYLALAQVAALFAPPQGCLSGVSEMAYVHAEADVADGADVYPFAFVGARARVGKGARLFPGVYVGEDASVGDGATMYPGSVLMAGCRLGAGAILQPGAVIGADGFGYAKGPRGLVKVPQTGVVEIGDEAEVGANATVDRGSRGDTRVGAGTKIDNLVMVAHNVEIGPHSVLVAQSGVAGSTKLGMGVTVAAQAGLVGHLNVGDGAKIGAQSGVMRDVPAGTEVLGSPADDPSKFFRSMVVFGKLPEMARRLRQLEKELSALKAELGKGEDK